MSLVLTNKNTKVVIGFASFGHIRIKIAKAYDEIVGILYEKIYNPFFKEYSDWEDEYLDCHLSKYLDEFLYHSDCNGCISATSVKEIYKELINLKPTFESSSLNKKYNDLLKLFKQGKKIDFFKHKERTKHMEIDFNEFKEKNYTEEMANYEIYNNKVHNCIAEDIEPDLEDFYMADLEHKAKDYDDLKFENESLRTRIKKIKRKRKNLSAKVRYYKDIIRNMQLNLEKKNKILKEIYDKEKVNYGDLDEV